MAQARSSGDALGASYRLLERIGSGAVGEVWRVELTETGDHFAAKLLRPEHAEDPAVVERFVRERSVLLGLTDPGIVRVRDLIVEGLQLAIVMDLVTGGSVRDLLRANGPLPARDALTITAETLRALAAAHRNSVAHRDVKPDNILLAESWHPGVAGAVRVTDFGIASVLDRGERQTTSLLGTPHYMAPELISHGRGGPPADVYGAGVLVYELLAGRTPFAGPGTDFAIAYRHVTSSPPPLDVPAALWSELERLLAKDPADRPSAADAAGRLTRLAASLSELPALVAVPQPGDFTEIDRPATVVRGFARGVDTASDLTDDIDGIARDATADTQAARLLPDLGEAGMQTTVRPVMRPATSAAPLIAPTSANRSPRPDWLTRRRVVTGVAAVVLVSAVVVGAVAWLPSAVQRSSTVDVAGTAMTTTAFHQDAALPTGLAVTREARYDRSAGTIALTLTYSAQAAPLGGDFLEAVPGRTKSDTCPSVSWSGSSVSARRNQPSITGVSATCGWSLSGIVVPADGHAVVTATVRIALRGTNGDSQKALDQWLVRAAASTTEAVEDPGVSGGAYAVQRLRDVEIRTPARTVSQSTLPVTLVPVWSSGPDDLDPLYRSPSTGSASRMLEDAVGGEKAVRFADGCSGALAVSSDGLVVTALSVAPSCTVRAVVGNFADLTSEPFGITTRD